MLEKPAVLEIELTPEQRRNLGHVYRMILGWRRERKNKSAPPPASETLLEEHPSPNTGSDSADQEESKS